MTEHDWQASACILCECNCGVEIRLGDDGRRFERIRGDKAHPASHELTDAASRDWIAGTPWHKTVPARLSPV